MARKTKEWYLKQKICVFWTIFPIQIFKSGTYFFYNETAYHYYNDLNFNYFSVYLSNMNKRVK